MVCMVTMLLRAKEYGTKDCSQTSVTMRVFFATFSFPCMKTASERNLSAEVLPQCAGRLNASLGLSCVIWCFQVAWIPTIVAAHFSNMCAPGFGVSGQISRPFWLDPGWHTSPQNCGQTQTLDSTGALDPGFITAEVLIQIGPPWSWSTEDKCRKNSFDFHTNLHSFG